MVLPVVCGLWTLPPAPAPDTPPPPLPASAVPGPLAHYDPYGLPHAATSAHFALRWDTALAPTPAQADAILALLEDAWDAGVEDLGMWPPTGSDRAFVNAYVGGSGPDAPPIAFVGGYAALDLQAVPYLVLAPELLAYVGVSDEPLAGIVTHEFFHVLQYSTDAFASVLELWPDEDQAWYWESTATWFAHHALPGNTWTAQGAGAYVLRPWLPVDHYEPDAADVFVAWRHYHAALFHVWLTEHVSSPDLIAESWRSSPLDADPLRAIDQLLVGEGTSLDAELPRFATHNATFDYADGDTYRDWHGIWVDGGEPDTRHVAEVDGGGLPVTVTPPAGQAPGPHGYALVELTAPPAAGLTLELDGAPAGSGGTPTALHVALATVDGAGAVDHTVLGGPVEDGAWTVEDLGEADVVYVAVTAQPTGAHPLEAFDFTLTVAALPEPPATSGTSTPPTTTEPPSSDPTATAPAAEPTGTEPDPGSPTCGCSASSPLVSPLGWLERR